MAETKCALVIGGGRGIGRAVCARLAADSYHVIVNYRSNTPEAQKTLNEILVSGGSAQISQFDITNKAETANALDLILKEHESIDALVFCAGIRCDELLIFMDEKQWDVVLDTNLKSFFTVARLIVKKMILQRQGRIVVISSTSGQAGLPGQVNYSASKAGLIGAVKALALECAKKNVLINAVAPGFIRTEMTSELNDKELSSRVPMQRFGEAREVASVVSFLLSDDASYITGQTIGVNGGIYM